MVWGSVTLSLLETTLLPDMDFTFSLGGMHGVNVRNYLTSAVGVIPTFIILIAIAICYFIYLSNETIDVIRKMMKPQVLLKENLRGLKNKNNSQAVAEEEDENNDMEPEILLPEEESEEYEDPVVSLSFSKDVGDEKGPQLILDTPQNAPADLDSVDMAEDEIPEVSQLTSEPYDPRKDLENYKCPLCHF